MYFSSAQLKCYSFSGTSEMLLATMEASCMQSHLNYLNYKILLDFCPYTCFKDFFFFIREIKRQSVGSLAPNVTHGMLSTS